MPVPCELTQNVALTAQPAGLIQVVTIAPPDPDNQLSLPHFAPSIERAQRLVGSGPYPPA